MPINTGIERISISASRFSMETLSSSTFGIENNLPQTDTNKHQGYKQMRAKLGMRKVGWISIENQ